ncbi:hypothetical protein [Bradyrhizobium sp. sBnM-33]|uniref:hypothetical protein n=1 Tax=Bradyrhizobium sp. sBnM-33 TaxID=2831780 RepID=UPI001BCCAC8C|nr:hypothetical protein [Bradyrhizobium sp. sBnM-33]WOH50680.1 hypothetical protein RX328_42895 [Bradyrhizobium sp. sBnM-33]
MSSFRHCLRLAWVCKTSAFSLLAGFALMLFFTEARDLFNDRIGTLGLVQYAALVLLVWSLQIWHSAKCAIDARTRLRKSQLTDGGSNKEVEDPARDTFDSQLTRTFPLLLGLLTFAAVWTGLFLSRKDILVCEQIQTGERLRSCLGYAFTQDLGDLQTAQEAAKKSGWLTSDYSLPEVGEALSHLGVLAIFIGIAAIIYLVVTLRLDRTIFGYLNKRLGPKTRLPWLADALTGITLTAEKRTLANLVVMGFLFAVAFYLPLELTDWAGRAALIPILLGSWIPLVDYLVNLSGRIQERFEFRWPIVATAIVALAVVSTYVDRFHDIRIYRSPHWQAVQAPSASSKATSRQIYIEEAIDKWMALNGCTNAPADCRMVLVAAEGGASRAAFFTATVLGTLLDITRSERDKYIDFAQATFALSGVSGGALGTTTFRTALKESTEGTPPCRFVDPIWFGATGVETSTPNRDPTKSWRACLQLLTAGDYLSPAIVGLSFRDHFALLAPSNRAVLLEQAIERHYNKVVHGKKTACGGPEDERGFCGAFGYLSPHDAKGWQPLLLLNATSMDNGRPILMSDIYTAVTSAASQKCKGLFVVAQNAFELYATNPFTPTEPLPDVMESCVYSKLERAADMRLSTATVLSARFPIISPAGHFRYEDEFRNIITDHVVDGGYFDNSGLESLIQIIPALNARGLRPTVLYLTNDPWFFKEAIRAGRPHSTSSVSRILNPTLEPPQQGFWSRALSWIMEPVATIYKLRSGHKEAALERAHDLLDGSVFVPIRVRRGVYLRGTGLPVCIDQPARQGRSRISLYHPVMSWWLSPITQRVLDAQLCDQENINALGVVLRELKRPAT